MGTEDDISKMKVEMKETEIVVKTKLSEKESVNELVPEVMDIVPVETEPDTDDVFNDGPEKTFGGVETLPKETIDELKDVQSKRLVKEEVEEEEVVEVAAEQQTPMVKDDVKEPIAVLPKEQVKKPKEKEKVTKKDTVVKAADNEVKTKVKVNENDAK